MKRAEKELLLLLLLKEKECIQWQTSIQVVVVADSRTFQHLFLSLSFYLFSPAVVVQSKIRRKEERKVKQANKVEHKCKVSE